MKLSSRDLLSRLGLPTLVSSSAHSQIVITCSSWYMLYSAIPVFYSASSCPVSFLLRPCFGCLLSALVIEQLLDELLGQTSPSCQPLCHCALPGLPEYTTCKTVSFLPPESKLTTSTSACCSSCSTNSPLIYSLFGIPFCVCYDILVRNVTKMINEIVLLHQTHIVCVAFTQQMICVQFHYWM